MEATLAFLLSSSCFLVLQHSRLSGRNDADRGGAPDCVSSRGVKALQPILSYFGMFAVCLGDLASKENPDGKIPLCVAENKLTQHLLRDRFLKASESAFRRGEAWAYNDMTGLSDMKQSVAQLWNRVICRGSDLVKETDVVLGAGAAAVLNNLFTCVCEAGDGVLIPAPYYAAFENDMEVLSGLIPLKVSESISSIFSLPDLPSPILPPTN